jgi:molybdopterin-containing oxidoreductase family iron-sulfur binding subunit
MSKREPYELKKGTDASPIFWKSLEEKAEPEKAASAATAEFPREAVDGVSRRGFVLTGVAGAAALALEGCARRPVENILPYSKAPEYQLPGIPVHYATVRSHRGDALGLIVENHEGRPTNVQGNPEHPGSLGALDAIGQASILDLYDPDRSASPRKGQAAASWDELKAALDGKLKALEADGGAKLRVLAQPTNSPTALRLRAQLLGRFPHARLHVWAPVNESNVREGARLAFGQPVNTIYDYGAARAIVALDSDFLGTEPGAVRATKSFARGRRLRQLRDEGRNAANVEMSRLYVVEPSYSTTGANADHRLRLPARSIEGYLLALAKELSTKGVDLGGVSAAFGAAAAPEGVPANWIKAVAQDLVANRGRSIVTVGSRQPARLHALAHAINGALSNVGSTVSYYPVADGGEQDNVADLKALVADIDAGRVDTLVLLGGNPVYDAPADLKLGDKLAKVGTSVHLSDRVDATSAKASWHIPMAHDLESWGDAQALDGTVALQQPMIAPLHDGKSEIEVLAMLAGQPANGYDLVRDTARKGTTAPVAFEAIWKKVLNRGLVDGSTARPFVTMPTRAGDIAGAFKASPAPKALGPDNYEITFAPDPKLFDGRHANNPWLLEMPDLMTKLSWDNAALVSPATAKALGVKTNDVVSIARDVGSIEMPVFVLPGQADNSIALALGWGRDAGRYSTSYAALQGSDVNPLGVPGRPAGVDAYPIRTSDNLGFADGVKVAKTGKTWDLVQTQEHSSMEGRPIAIDTTLAEYKKTPDFAQYRTPDPKVLPLWKPVDYTGHKWGMVIDLSTCTGCDACIVACQSENNIATVGREQVFRNREMYWIRIDRYFLGEDENAPGVAIQPVACVQCEEAPCENVCPVNATAHSPEGLNDMAYNRCIGTRYCANNCPYKVRRFNYLEFQGGPIGGTATTMYGDLPETRKMAFNPDVTVRMRGVMEKCTYCVQRIQEAKISAKRDDRPMKDGDVTPACAQTCPADAIVFGDLNDPQSRVARLSKFDRGYHLLSELGTHPRTTYLGKIRNPNPAMEQG